MASTLAPVTANDTTFSSGISGLLIFDSFGGPWMGSCDNISSSAIVAELTCHGDGAIDVDDISSGLTTASDATNTAWGNSTDVLLLGDVNLDGDVDSVDRGLLLNNFSATNGVDWRNGDLNGSDGVDSVGLGLLLNDFGHASAAASMAAVPEPASLSLFANGMRLSSRCEEAVEYSCAGAPTPTIGYDRRLCLPRSNTSFRASPIEW